MFYNKDISKKQLKLIKDKSPFDKFIITGDLNNENVNQIIGVKSNNFKSTCENKIIDYILPIGYDIGIEADVINIDLKNTSDHYPVKANINELYFE